MGAFTDRKMAHRFLLAVSLLICGLMQQTVAGERTFPLSAKPYYPDPDDRRRVAFGPLSYAGGIEISSDQSVFGGYSGLIVSRDGGSVLAVSDAGHWLRADLVYNDGRLTAIGTAHILALRDVGGRALHGKRTGDAEAIARLPGTDFYGDLLVSFERDHRVLRYRHEAGGRIVAEGPVIVPEQLADAPSNKGIEALLVLADGRTLLITERMRDGDGNLIGWLLRQGEAAQPIRVARKNNFDVTDLAQLPDGDLLLLERRFTLIGGAAMRLRRIAYNKLGQPGPLDGETLLTLTARNGIDNMEGLDVRQTEAGETLLYLMSDDNFNSAQKTLLLMFRLDP